MAHKSSDPPTAMEPEPDELDVDAWLDEPPRGTWWDGAGKEVLEMKRLLREMRDTQRQISNTQTDLKVLVNELHGVQKSKTRTKQLDTGVTAALRRALLAHGVLEPTIDAAIHDVLNTTRGKRGTDANRKATKRLNSLKKPQ